ncbi:MAG: peptidoglycan DD-metalloendopeptidase family protein [Bacteroidales bacterium]|nr:peptidoglycan DD-metalloendopeptidase family protein [Bacteroidales bacterium]
MRKAISIMLAMLLICSQGLAQKQPQAQSSSQKKAKLEREIAILDQQLKENASKTRSANTALKLTRKKISTRKNLVKESEAQISMLDRRIREKDKKIDSLRQRYDLLSDNYEKLVRTAYKNRDTRIWYMYLLSSEGLTQGLRRFGYLKTMANGLNAQALEIKDTRAKIEEEKVSLQKLREEASVLRSTRVGELKKLEADESHSAQLVASLNKDKARYQKELAAKKKQVEALKAEMNKMVKKSTSKPKTAVDEKLDKEFASNMGKLPWPADGPVVDSFGKHYHPVYKNVEMPFNNGVNIALSKDTAVKAVFDGTVSNVVVIPGYKKCVLVQHGGYFTFYCKLASVNVKAGDKIKTGQVLGRVDTIAGETQLHFELWEGKNPQNPEFWLK